jgi:peptidoglycan/xylan/chitin deacetylase (PgdA/CDA1 family)
VPPDAAALLRAPALVAASVGFLVLVGWGPGLSTPGRHVEASAHSQPGTAREAPRAPANAAGKRHVVGCHARGASFRRHASRRHHAVGLGFDDGPSPFTPRFLHVLRANHAHATFFEIGRLVPGHAALMRQILRQGSSIGNHSLTHSNLAGGGRFARFELRKTSALIHHATGFRPCLFRAPYGAVSSRLVREARAAGMLTIQWDVDPHDYVYTERPHYIAGAVSKAVRGGSIVVMHDGGGDRSRTLRALPLLLHRLRRHGYKAVSIERLLGLKREYRRG